LKPRLAFAGILLAGAAPAAAHAGEDHGWTVEPWILVPMLLCLMLNAAGVRRLLGRAGKSRAALRRRAWLFGAGWLVLAGATLSPLHEAGSRSFSLHMIEHELIMLAAAPMLALSRPLATMIWAFPAGLRRMLGRMTRAGAVRGPWLLLSAPVAATAVQLAAMWAWHSPGLFERALRSEAWHAAQHVSFLAAALLFWWAVARREGRDERAGLAALCLFLTSLGGGALGAAMTFSASPWYGDYATMGMTPWGLTPEEDQQLAGLLMWIPGGMVHAGAALLMLMRVLRPRRPGPAIATIARPPVAGRQHNPAAKTFTLE
jgi:cytochrome c oxidase assembly factor CtaG